ncbi:hypothetical protein GCM10010967_01140 [Dyadobacter beijingensis]|uniref:Uncharacterized protein n=1 Tax=Dyadobacter beijingensis TaxID=365489 RepID=A0ABQ2HBZ1_9BACT|nr:hypothetical protein [Dyadobacter beijingensis]GGM73344.1 hypothetical protein GCM10010967_01140 [Dyadobacter beijingensis]
MKLTKKITPWLLVLALICSISGLQAVSASPVATAAAPDATKVELFGKKKKYKGYKKPRSKKFLGIFKRKTDCGCPNH